MLGGWSTQHLRKSHTPYNIRGITLYLKSLLCTLTMKPLGIRILILVLIQSLLSGLSITVSLFVLKYKSGVENKIINAFSRIRCLLHTMRVEVLGLDRPKETYSSCPDLGLCFWRVIVDLMWILFSMTIIYFEVLNYASLGLHSETS